MTAKQMSMVDKALKRAHDEGLRILGTGYNRQTGARVLIVSSASDPIRGHVVTVQGDRLHCDCTAAQYEQYCMHRALVHEALVAESEARAEAQRPAHETAMLMNTSRGNAPVSIWKA
jgi:hypothetical protein